MTKKNLNSEDFKTLCTALREEKQPKVKRKIPRDLHTLRIKGGDNQK